MIYNATRRNYIAKEHRICRNIFCMFKGLMFSRRKEGHGLVFDFKRMRGISLHMAFVFYAIDVIFLDDKKKVVEILENFKPFAKYFPKNKFRFVIESPTGAVKKSGTKVGDVVRFM